MIARCQNPTDKDYPRTGGAGVQVHPAWMDYPTFLRDVGEAPENAQLRRLDATKHFEPGNVTWRANVNSRTNELYGIWKGMRRRCGYLGNDPSPRYEGRGITICDRWANDFHAFAEDMGPRPSPDHSLDREHNDGDYTPDNCRWATRAEQANNTSATVIVEYRGERLSVSQWAQKLGVPVPTFGSQVEKLFSPRVDRTRGRRVAQLSLAGEVIHIHACRKDAAQSGVSVAAISACLAGNNRTAGGYVWQYVD